MGSRKPRSTTVGIRCADHATPYIRKSWHQLRRQAAVALSVYRLRNKVTEFSFYLVFIYLVYGVVITVCFT
jgi:hypothetical protein